jgi:deoxyhypusine synthase
MPERYFEELDQNILMSLAKRRHNKVVSLIRQSIATAAAISLLVVMYATSFSNEMNQNINTSAVMLETAEKEDIEIYFEAINWDLQNEDLALLIETTNE